MRLRPWLLPLSLLVSTGCAVSPAVYSEASVAERNAAIAAQNDPTPPVFDNPTFEEYKARYVADRAALEQNPEGTLGALVGPSTCTLAEEDAQRLVLGQSKDEWERNMKNAGVKGKIRRLELRVLSGECPNGRLHGPATFRYVWEYETSSSGYSSGTTTDSRVEADFVSGAYDGNYRMVMRTKSTNSFAPGETESFSFHYGERKGDEVGSSVMFAATPVHNSLTTIVTEQIEPGLAATTSYQGPDKMSLAYIQDGKMHGEFRMFARTLPGGLEFEGQVQCYNAGQLVNVEACDGPNVDVARAKPVDYETDAKRIAAASAEAKAAKKSETIEAPAAAPSVAATPAPTQVATQTPTPTPTPTPAPATGAVAASTHWPDLAAAMAATGGGEKDAAIIVGVEDYAFVADVPGADDNAKDWYRYFTRVRKTSPGNVRLLVGNDATDVSMRTAMQETAARMQPGGTLWFVFIGHGAPSADQKDGLLVGVDAQQSAQGLYGRSVPQQELIAMAGVGKQDRTVFVVDACFSGRTGDGAALASGLQPLLPVTQKIKDKRTLVFTAGRADQFAGPLPKHDRPAFSYLMLGGLLGWSDQNADGWVSSKELVNYSNDTLRAVLNGRNQTPELFPARDENIGKSAGAPQPDVTAIVLGD